jgi:predicted transcriptional regulator
VANIRKAEALAEKALSELENKNYTYEYKYVEKFGQEDFVYTLTKGEELVAEMQATYTEFSDWLGSWEM